MRNAIASYFKAQIGEIASDVVLRAYGALLALTHILTVLWWLHADVDLILSYPTEHICWPLLETCHGLSYPYLDQTHLIFGVLAGVAAAVMVLFYLGKKFIPAAYWLLLVLQVFKLCLMAMDFRTRMNQHYMAFFVTVAFLLIPHKRNALKLIIPFFYFWAGTLKLNQEWLSGAALYGDIWFFNQATLPWACAYVVALELFLVWGLWAKNKWVFWATLAQLTLFHLLSFSVVSFFYPLLMFSILAIFPLARLIDDGKRGMTLKQLRPGIAWVLCFSFLQLLPHFFPGDTALTGEGRLFALHMFDSRVVCESHATIRRTGANPEVRNLVMPLPVRIQCDPIVYLSHAKRLCASLRSDPGFLDLDLALSSRRTTDPALKPVIGLTDFCRTNPSYSLFWTNDWILK